LPRRIWFRLYMGQRINPLVMKRRILFFINPISGTRKKTGLEEKLLEKTKAAGFYAEIAYTNAEANYTYLPEKITKEKITDVVVCGGDGSVNLLGEYLLGLNINIGIIPMGSGNGLAFTALIPKNIDRALAIIFKGEAKWVDAFRINDTFSVMLCGLGLDAQVAADFAAKGQRGLTNYIKQSALNFIKAKPFPFEISIHEKVLNTKAYFISIANSNQFGNNFTIAPQASLNDGLLDIVVVKKMNKLKMIWSVIMQVRTGKVSKYEDDDDKGDVLYFQADKFEIKNPGMAPLHIDGEAVETSEVFKFKIIPNALRLLQP